MPSTTKDTIYIDIDDEITSIIDKVNSSDHKIVALVLPKRATMLQSSVNMKLLKRAAEKSKKHLVLITSEAGLLPLAAASKMHVAKTLQSKPEIPEVDEDAAAAIDDKSLEAKSETEDSSVEDDTFDTKAAAAKPIGELAGLPEDETIELDNTKSEKPVDEATVSPKKGKSKVSKALRVPNFEKFRVRLIIAGGVLILLVAGFFVANNVLPKAVITVDTDTSTVNSSLTVSVDSGAKTLDATKLVVPAKIQQTPKTSTQQVATTGQKNEGTKANGTVLLSLADCSQSSVTIPAGTGVSSNGLTFITQVSETLSSVIVAGKCKNSSLPQLSTADVNVISQQAGSQYNIGPASFAVAGFSNVTGSSSAAMSGGTDNIIKVVSQADIDGAKQKLTTQDSSVVKSELQNDLQTAGLYAIPVTFNAGTPTVTTSANVGDQADTVTVTQVSTYAMLGVKQSDLEQLIKNYVNTKIDPSKQTILDDGIIKADFTVISATPTSAQLTMQATAVAGPQLNTNDLKKQIAGKKSGQIKAIISANPGVTSVAVNFSPFWVDTTPKNAGKVTIKFVKTSQTNAGHN